MFFSSEEARWKHGRWRMAEVARRGAAYRAEGTEAAETDGPRAEAAARVRERDGECARWRGKYVPRWPLARCLLHVATLVKWANAARIDVPKIKIRQLSREWWIVREVFIAISSQTDEKRRIIQTRRYVILADRPRPRRAAILDLTTWVSTANEQRALSPGVLRFHKNAASANSRTAMEKPIHTLHEPSADAIAQVFFSNLNQINALFYNCVFRNASLCC